MRVLGWVVMVLWLPGGVLAAPEPPPPGDYPGAQYIDRTGCVFLRSGSDWLPRLDRQGQRICGFPPSKPAEEARADPAPPLAEEILTATLAEGLKPGDLVTDMPAQPVQDLPPDPDQAALTETLARDAALDRRLRSITARDAPAGLCARLGYRPIADAGIAAGDDVTRGLCPGMVADPGPALSIGAPTPVSVEAPDTRPRAASGQDSQTASAEPRSPPRMRSDNRKDAATPHRSSAVIARRAAPSRPAPSATAEMIPAHARYVQIGIYADEHNALSALRGLSAMGYRAAQRPERIGTGIAKAILAGPFGDRQALVRALTRLRENGYPRAVAR